LQQHYIRRCIPTAVRTFVCKAVNDVFSFFAGLRSGFYIECKFLWAVKQGCCVYFNIFRDTYRFIKIP